jgi:hypothetical protein
MSYPDNVDVFMRGMMPSDKTGFSSRILREPQPIESKFPTFEECRDGKFWGKNEFDLVRLPLRLDKKASSKLFSDLLILGLDSNVEQPNYILQYQRFSAPDPELVTFFVGNEGDRATINVWSGENTSIDKMPGMTFPFTQEFYDQIVALLEKHGANIITPQLSEQT